MPASSVRPGAVRPHPLVRLGHAVGITSPRRAAVLAVVVCALALSVAVPLRNYLGQQDELAAVRAEQQVAADEVAELERRRELLSDPQHIEAQARERLRYVHPGETPWVVQLPPQAEPAPAEAAPEPEDPWYSRLWASVSGG